MRVRFAPAVERDLNDIAAWIARYNPAAAVRFAAELTAKAINIGHAPNRFPIVHRRTGGELRKRTYRSHVIIYRVARDVIILRIVDARRDYLSLIEGL